VRTLLVEQVMLAAKFESKSCREIVVTTAAGLLLDKDQSIRRRALGILDSCHYSNSVNPQIFPQITAALNESEDPNVKEWAAHVLAKVPEKSHSSPLTYYKQEWEKGNRSNRVIGNISQLDPNFFHDESRIADLLTQYNMMKFESNDRQALKNILIAIGEPAMPQLLKHLTTASKSGSHVAQDPVFEVVKEIGSPSALLLLTKSLGNPRYDHKVIEALGKIGPRAAPSILPYLKERQLFESSDYQTIANLGAAGASLYPRLRTMIPESCDIGGLYPADDFLRAVHGVIGSVSEVDAKCFAKIFHQSTHLYKISERDKKTAHLASRIVAKLGRASVPPLVQLLKASDDNLNLLEYSRVLGQIGPAAQPAVSEIIKRMDVRMENESRLEIFNNLLKISPKSPLIAAAIAKNIKVLRDEKSLNNLEDEERLFAMLASMHSLGWSEFLKIEKDEDENNSAIQGSTKIINHIGHFKTPQAVSHVLKAYKKKTQWSSDTDFWTIMGKIGPKAASSIPILMKPYKDKELSGEHVAFLGEAISQMGPAGVQELGLLLADIGYRENVLYIISKLKDTSIAKLLTSRVATLLSDPDEGIRFLALSALNNLSPEYSERLVEQVEKAGRTGGTYHASYAKTLLEKLELNKSASKRRAQGSKENSKDQIPKATLLDETQLKETGSH
jgi:HEAT repeat protein